MLTEWEPGLQVTETERSDVFHLHLSIMYSASRLRSTFWFGTSSTAISMVLDVSKQRDYMKDSGGQKNAQVLRLKIKTVTIGVNREVVCVKTARSLFNWVVSNTHTTTYTKTLLDWINLVEYNMCFTVYMYLKYCILLYPRPNNTGLSQLQDLHKTCFLPLFLGL